MTGIEETINETLPNLLNGTNISNATSTATNVASKAWGSFGKIVGWLGEKIPVEIWVVLTILFAIYIVVDVYFVHASQESFLKGLLWMVGIGALIILILLYI